MPEYEPPVYEHETPLEEILASRLFLSFPFFPLIEDYTHYLSYRVQRDLYELRPEFAGISWDTFILAVQNCEMVQISALAVLKETVKIFCEKGYFDFWAEEKPLYNDRDRADAEDGEYFVCVMLFDTDEERYRFINSIFYRAQIINYYRQLGKGKDYSWTDYLLEVRKSLSMQKELLCAVQDMLQRLDFKPVWQSENLEEIVMKTIESS